MILKVKVQPKSSQRNLEKISETEYKAHLFSAPSDNQANEELIELIAEEFGLKKYQVEIVKGLTARHKLIRLEQ